MSSTNLFFGSPMAAAADSAKFSVSDIRSVMIGLVLALFLDGLDQTIVATSLSTMARDLGGWQSMSWVVAAYMLSSTTMTPIYGRLSDLYGRRPVLLFAIVVFMACSIFCGLAQTMPQLILGRFLQGIGGGGLRSVSLVVIADMIPPRERGLYQGYLSGGYAASSVFGPVLGGFLTEYLSWHWIFWINLPLAVLTILLCNQRLKRLRPPERKPRIDWLGAVLIIAGSMSLLYGIGQAEHLGNWTAPEILIAFAVGIVGFAALIAWEAIAPEPMLPLSLFRSRTFVTSCATTSLVNMIYNAMIVLIPIAYQLNGFSINQSGICLIPFTISGAVMSVLAGRIIARTGKTRILVIGGCIGLILACALLARIGFGSSIAMDIFVTTALGLTMGFVFNPATVMVLNALPVADTGIGISSQVFFRRLAATFGVALFTSLLTADINAGALAVPGHEALGADPGFALMHLDSLGVPLSPELYGVFMAIVHAAFTKVFLLALGIAAISLVFAFCLRETPLRGYAEEPGREAPAGRT